MKELQRISKEMDKLIAAAQPQYVDAKDEITKSTLNGKLIAYWQCKNLVENELAKLEEAEAKKANK